MTREVKKYLFDIREAIKSINSFMPERKDFNDFKNNTLVKRAIERELEIIGEAINKVLKVDPNIQIRNARKIVDLRNFIIHSYDRVSDEILWSITIKNIPELEQDIIELLKKDIQT